MNRRAFLQTTGAGLALATAGTHASYADDKPRRVGLIGCGWYGKIDLLRLIQIAPVEVVSLCDVDKTDAGEAADMVRRGRHQETPRTYSDYREMLREKDLDHRPDWHARSLACVDHDRRGEVRHGHLCAETDQRRYHGR